MLLKTARVLERNVAANTDGWMLREREAELAQLRHPLKRWLGRHMLELAIKHQKGSEKALDICARTAGYNYLGAGVEFSTYLRRADDKAVKVHRSSAGQPVEVLEELAAEKRTGHGLLTDYLGTTVLPQTVLVAEHVLGGGFLTVQIEQPYVPLADKPSPFSVNQTEVDIAELENLVKKRPGSDVALHELIWQSRRLFGDQLQLPDTNGTNNLVVHTNGSLALLDSTPIGSEQPAVQELILSQVNSLEHGLIELGV